jgi:hypothetical protein
MQYTQVHEFMAIDLIERIQPQVLVMEKFVLQRRPHIDTFPIELIGTIHRYHENHPGCILVEHMPSNIKGVTEAILKECDLWIPGHPHAVDAMRHLVFYYLSPRASVSMRMEMHDVLAKKCKAHVEARQ